MNIWLDLSNAPHVPFFLPIVARLRKDGHEVHLTLRDFNQTVELARFHGLQGSVIGSHGGKSLAGKILNLVSRTFSLVKFARRHAFDLAISHNSYTHILAARLCCIPSVTMMDYEGQPANHIAFRLAGKILVPDCFPTDALRKFGARPDRVRTYDGFKEQLYLSDFMPAAGFVEELKKTAGLPPSWSISDHILVTVRTPATKAAYHAFENPLFDLLLERLDAAQGSMTVLVFPRYPEQRQLLREKFPNLFIPEKPVDGRNLVYFSDLVISAGGTMNREAAILGTPAYTIFAGAIPAVDRKLIAAGRMSAISSRQDVDAVRFIKNGTVSPLVNPLLLDEIVGRFSVTP